MLTAAAVEKAKSFEGPEGARRAGNPVRFQGTGGVYNFSPTVHQGITQNPFLLASIAGGNVRVRQ